MIISKEPTQSPHEHPSSHNKCVAERIKASLKWKAEERPEQPPVQLLRSELDGVRQDSMQLL